MTSLAIEVHLVAVTEVLRSQELVVRVRVGKRCRELLVGSRPVVHPVVHAGHVEHRCHVSLLFHALHCCQMLFRFCLLQHRKMLREWPYRPLDWAA